ncbi:MAG: IPT/TIG domain-containing protein [Candidatus Hydrogenedentes bacterium]|nr:IPT/TIG domain-containing protein [Candidatus Hydrogenedentota bacterium]
MRQGIFATGNRVRTSLARHAGGSLRALIALAALAACCVPAMAQNGAIVACQATNGCPAGAGNSPYTDLQEAIDDAVTLSETNGQQVLVLVVGGPWTVTTLTIPADANIRIIGVPYDLRQLVGVIDADGGTFTLTFTDPATGTTETTGDIDWDATAAEVQTALEALAAIDAGDVTVTGADGGPFLVEFTGGFADSRMTLLVATSSLTNSGGGSPFVVVRSVEGPQDVVIQGGGAAPVVEIVAEDTATLPIAYDATAADIEAALEALDGIGVGNVDVTGTGPFTIDFSAGALAGEFVRVLTVDDSGLLGAGAAATVASTDPVNNATQELTISNATGGSFRLAFGISSRTDRLVIEGVTLTGGTDGVQLRGFANISTTFAPVLNRCYIQGNAENGVRVQDNGSPKLINCSISSNDEAGVYVGDGIVNATGAFADLLHCSLIDNGERGVYVEQGENARVRNTLVFQNGDGAPTEGGLVWEANPFIDPDVGPVDGGTSVTITGSGFGSTGNTLVYFGPPDKPGTVATNVVVNAAATQITCDTPPAWTGAPGPVDVYIVRTDDNFTLRVPDAFTYQADLSAGTDPLPVVNYVSPGWGPIDIAATTTVDESAIDVYVYGANFDPDCEVWFDWNGNGVINLAPLDGQSPRVRWLSSGLLLARVPTRTAVTAPARIDVLVRNVPTGEESLAGPLEEYEYRAVGGVRPEITGVVPDEASALDGASVEVDVYGANFADDCVVLIGGIVCPYSSVHVSGVVIEDVQVPVTRFGGGGVYDVEVINPNGTWDVLPDAFTYFPTGEPGVDPGTSRAWRVANFVEDGAGGNRELGGFGFDYVVDVFADPDGVNVLFADNVNPTAQRTLPLTFPPLATTIDASLNVEVDIEAINDDTMPPANTSTTTADAARATMYYAELRTNLPIAGEALYFEISSVTSAINAGNPDDLSVTILNYQTSMDIYVGDVLVDPADYTTAPADAALGGSETVVFPAPDQPEGVWGPVDIRVELPNGVVGENDTAETLYYVVENAYSYRRDDQLPEVYAVTPDTVRDDQIVTLRITGANFLSMQNPDGSLNGIYTRAWIDADGTVANGNEIDLSLLPTYRVVSFSEIQVDIRLDDLDAAAAIIPRAPTAVGVRVEQFDSVGGVVLTSAGNPLSSYLSGVVTFIDGATAPQITNVANNIDGRPTGPVSGYDPIADANVEITITGTNFGADEGQVLFGTAQALITSWADATIVVELPPAPAGLPGIYDVTVIKPDTAVPDDYRVATLRDGFTYYMDGTPFIAEISPNHRADGETNDLFITIRGYNFDDVVDVKFEGTGTNDVIFEDVKTISPTEIVIRAPLPDAISDPADFATNPVTVPVRLWNDGANLDETQATAANMISNDVDFYLYNDGRGNVNANLPTLLYNDVYDNVVSDYINVAAGAGSIAVDPGLLPGAFWLGKLVINTESAPLLNTAGPFTEGSYTLLDFEGEVRPTGDGAEIGADEISDFLFGGTLLDFFWIFARPTPNPVGLLDAGELIVELQFTGDAIGPDTEVFIVPQGGEPLTDGDRIELDLYQQLGRGRYLFQNADAIETIVRDADGSGTPTLGDIIADGHAAIYLEDDDVAPGRIFGYDPVDLTDGGFILPDSQAVYGRHFLIDTVPPRVFVEVYTGGQAVAADLIASSDDTINAMDADPATHPFPALPTGITADLPNGWTPSTFDVPSSYYGALTIPPLAGVDGVKVFFNNGSVASNAAASPPGTDLTYTAAVRYIDRPIKIGHDPMGPDLEGTATDTDRFTGLNNRQVAGFLFDEVEPDNLEAGAGRWQFSTGADLLAAQPAPVTVAYATVASGANPNAGVFDPNLIPGDGDYVPDPDTPNPNVGNDELQAQWTVGPLDWDLANDNTFHLAGEPHAVDLAGNMTDDIADYLTDPLHIWWIINTQSRLVPDREGQSTNRPNFTMQLDRNFDPQAEGGPVPLYTYRVYTSAVYAGVYNPVIAWTDWSPVTSIDDIQNIPGILGQWVLVICQAADEAGNVEPWAFDPVIVPPDGPIDLTDPLRDELARALPNWMRFFYTDRDSPNTRVTHTIWYDVDGDGEIDPNEPNLGAARLAPLPGDINIPVRVEFLVSTVRPAGTSATINVQWEFVDDGVLGDTDFGGYFGDFASDADVKRIVASFPTGIVGAKDPYLGDVPDRQRPITYVFRASAYEDVVDDDSFVPTDGEQIDQTPANVYFTVVPTGVANFIREPAGEDDQPIKEQENR